MKKYITDDTYMNYVWTNRDNYIPYDYKNYLYKDDDKEYGEDDYSEESFP